MVQKVPFTSTSGNTMTIGTGTSRVIMGADSGNLKIQDSQSNTSIIEAGAGIVGASAVSVVANPAALPFNPISSAGSLAYTTSTNALYISNGSGWYKISMVNTSPSLSLSSVNAEPTSETLTLDFTYTVTEPEGTPTTVTFANSGISTTDVATITHTTSNNHVRIVFDGETTIAGATVTLSVSDGVNTGTGTITINTAYSLLNSKYEALTLLATNPPGITTVKQQSLLHTTSYDTLAATHNDFAPGSGDFTVECWFKPTAVTANQLIYDTAQAGAAGSAAGRIALFLNGNPNKMAVYQPGVGVTTASSGSLSAGTWYHLAWVRNSGTLRMYLDGTEVGSYSTTYDFSRGTLIIGRDQASGGGSPLNGRLSNLRMVKGTAVYTSAFTPPTSPLTAITNTKLLIAQGSTTDNSGSNHSFTLSGNPFHDVDSPFAPAGTLFTNKYVRDTSDSAHTMELRGTAAQSHTTTVSPYTSQGYSAFFDGSGDSITMPHDGGWQFGTGDFTVEAWVYPNTIPNGGVNTDMTVWGHFGSTQTMFFYLSNDTLTPTLWNGSSSHGSTKRAKLNQWTHIAWVRSSSTMKTYVNGQLGGTTNSYTTNFNEGTKYPWIGASEFSNRYFHGYISDLRVVKGTAVYTTDFTPPRNRLTAITNTELLACHLPYFKDGSSNNLTLTVNGNTYLESFAPYDRETYDPTKHGGSFYIDNTSDGNLETTDKATNQIQLGTGDFTVELWYRPKSVTSTWEAIISKAYTTTGGWRLYKDTGNGYLKWYSSTTLKATTTSAVLKNDTWTHIAVVRNSGTLKIYADGVEAQSVSDTYNYTTSSAYEIEVGSGRSGSSWTGEGWISDVRIVVGTPVYTGAFTPPTRPLTKTGGTYPSTTNVNTSITSAHTKLLLNLKDVLIGDATQFQSLEMEGNVTSSLGKSKFTDKPSIYFDGNGDYLSQNIQAPDDADIMKIGTQDFTVEGYVYALTITADSQYRRIFAYGDNGTDSIQVYINPSTGAFVYTSNDSSIKITGTTNIQNTWKHFAVTRSGNRVQLHVNGTVEGTAVTDNGNKTQAAGSFIIGKYPGFSGHFHGYLDSLRVLQGKTAYPYYSEPVTLSTSNSGMTKPDGTTPTATASNTKLLIFNTSTITDEGSSTSHTLTKYGNAAASSFGPKTGMYSAYIPNGDTDVVTIPASTEHQIYGGNYTMECWLYPTSWQTYSYFLSKGGNTTREWGFAINPSDFTVYWNTSGSGGAGDSSYQAPVSNSLHEWAHFAVTKSGTTLSVFKNGAFIGSGTFTSIYGGNGLITIGRLMQYGGIAHDYHGYISNLRIITGQVLYDKDFTPPSRFR